MRFSSSSDRLREISTILKRYKGKYYNLDYWRVTLNMEMRNSDLSMNNKTTAQHLNCLRRMGKIERIGKAGKYLYKVK